MLDERETRWLLGVVGFGAFALLLGLEIATEENFSPLQLVLETAEIGLMIASAAGITLLLGRVEVQRREKVTLIRDLEMARAEGRGFRERVQSHLDGLGAAIEKQFQAWLLTDAEREVGLLMLKGFSHKEIAALRGTTEPAVRQQARTVYQKSSLNGRAAFAAFFLEDLLPPGALDHPGEEEATLPQSG